MDNELALKLVKNGGTFIFLNVPEGFEFGIDMKSWTTGPKFKGVKMIPAGPHFIYYNARNEYGDVSPRSGFIHIFQKGEFLVKKWDTNTEDISSEEISEKEVNSLKDNLLDLDKFLGPYPYEVSDKWKSLSKNITENVIQRLTPASGIIRSAAELVRVEKTDTCVTKKRWSKSRTEEERQEDLLPELIPVSGTQIRFTDMPNQRYPDGSSPSEITSHYLDSTYALNNMLTPCSSPVEFVGEIQFAYLCFLIGQNLEAFEQWIKLVQLMCSCTKAIKRYTHMYSEFVSSLEVHLEEVPADFLVDIVSNNNVIYRSLRDFFANMQTLQNDIDGRLFCKVDRFKDKLTSKFGWDFTNLEVEEDENAPVVVDL